MNINWKKKNDDKWEFNLANVLILSVSLIDGSWQGMVQGAFNFHSQVKYKKRYEAMENVEEMAKHALYVATQKIGE